MWFLNEVLKLVRKYGLRLLLGLVVLVIFLVGVFYACVEFTPFDAAKLDAQSPPTQIYARDGSVYMTIGGEGASNLSYNQIPADLRNALVATEEHSYWTDSSVDLRGMFRSVFVDLLSRSYAQGGSTIEMQLAKIVYLNQKKTLLRKFQQVILGVQINRYYTKQEILAMYLNKVYLGENCIGVKQAAMRYFGVDLSADPNALTLPEAALLAGLPQAPNGYDPFLNPQAALIRRNQVLDNMAKYGDISAATAAHAKAEPLGVSRHDLPGDAWDTHPLSTSFLLDYANRQGISPEEILQGGLKIYTTLDPTVQSAIDQVFWSDNYNGDFPSFAKDEVLQGAALFVDPSTGGILGGAGSRKAGFVPGGLDRIYSTSSPGSSIKPIMEYAPAIASGQFTPSSILNNTPHDFGGGYVPQNYDRGSAPGECTLSYALQTSQNVASVYLLQQIGLPTGTSFAANDGIPINNQDRNQLGIAIGGDLNVSPYIMAQAYEAFDNQGIQMQEHLITKVVNQQGDTIYSYQSAAKRIMSTQTAATMTGLLRNVVTNGTGVDAQVPGWQVAGKTGTVQYSSSDADPHSNWLSRVWFDGYTGNMVGSIYLGYDTTDVNHHLVDFPDPVASCERVFSDIVTLAEVGKQPVPLDASSSASPPPAQPASVPIANLSSQYSSNFNSLTLHWTSKTTNQPLRFVISRATLGTATSAGNGQSAQGGQGTVQGAPGATPPSSAGAGQQVTLGRTSGTSFVDPNVQPSFQYQYTVQPVDAGTGQPVGQAATLTVTIPETSTNQGGQGANGTNGSQNNTTPGQNGASNGTDNGIVGNGTGQSAQGPGAGTNNGSNVGNSGPGQGNAGQAGPNQGGGPGQNQT